MNTAVIYLLATCCLPTFLALQPIIEDWETYKETFDKRYNIHEELFRKNLFLKNLEEVKEHNARFEKGLVTFAMGINQFSDMTKDELHNYKGLKMNELYFFRTLNATQFVKPKNFEAPYQFDWRQKGVLNPVKNQKNCGSCWAFATIATVESQYAINKRQSLSLSEQQLVDCDRNAVNNGCNGGNVAYAYDYIRDNGIMLENEYPYQAIDGQCRSNSQQSMYTLSSYNVIDSRNEEDLKVAVATNGPVAVGIALPTSKDFQRYHGGIYYGPCGDDLNHAVVVVGYGTENGHDYWIVRNSWSAQWGERGYIRMARGINVCGIANDALYPEL